MSGTDWRRQWRALAWLAGGFAALYLMPVGHPRFDGALLEAFHLVRWYAREHVILCLLPAFFIAGAIGVFVSQGAVMRYLGPAARKPLAYGVAAVSGTVLAVCSCTVLPLFAGIYGMGAGLGPATAFLYSGPAVNVLAVILTARVLGPELGLARALGAMLFSVAVGLLMHLLFRRGERARVRAAAADAPPPPARPLRQTALLFAAMVAVLVLANWGRPGPDAGAAWGAVHAAKWWLTGAAALALGVMLAAWMDLGWRRLAWVAAPTALLALLGPWRPLLPFGTGMVLMAVALQRRGGEPAAWLDASWGFARQILPLLLGGVLAAGLLLGRPGAEGLVPSRWIAAAVGGNGLGANLFASVAGAFMYFATLTEVPILEGLVGAGMGKGPALALLLAGPALSLPNMLVIASVMGARRTAAFVALVVAMATIAGLLYGNLI